MGALARALRQPALRLELWETQLSEEKEPQESPAGAAAGDIDLPAADPIEGPAVAPSPSPPGTAQAARPGITARVRSLLTRIGVFFGRVRDFLRTAASRTKNAALSVRAAVGRAWVAFLAYAQSLQTSPRARYLTLVWIFFSVFAGTVLLSASNPLRLLVPALAFPIPKKDSRPTVTLYSVTAVGRALVPIRRRIQLSPDSTKLAQRILFALTRPPAVQVQESDDFRDLIPLPGLGASVRGIWARPNGLLVLDLRSVSLADDLQKTAENRRPLRTEAEYMDAFIRSYARSVFEVIPQLRTVQFLIDGERKVWKGLSFDLRLPITRDSLQPTTAPGR